MTPRAEIARNEAFFRAVNEGIAEASERFESDEAEFLCECGDDRCTHRIEVPLREYERVRQSPTRFLVRRGHVIPEVEEVVQRRRRYTIVRRSTRWPRGSPGGSTLVALAQPDQPRVVEALTPDGGHQLGR